MAAPIKEGKKPIQARPTTFDPQADQLFGSMLDIPTPLKAELESQGLEYRWIDAKRAVEGGGFHKNGWTPYHRRTADTIEGVADFKFGSDPTGLVRRDTVVLAVRPKDKGERHRQFLSDRARRYSVLSHQKAQADQLKQTAKGSGFKTSIHEGYEENED